MERHQARAEFRRATRDDRWVLAGVWVDHFAFVPATPGVEPITRRLPDTGLLGWADLPPIIAPNLEAAELRSSARIGRIPTNLALGPAAGGASPAARHLAGLEDAGKERKGTWAATATDVGGIIRGGMEIPSARPSPMLRSFWQGHRR